MLEPFVKMGNKSIRRNLLDQLRSLNKEQPWSAQTCQRLHSCATRTWQWHDLHSIDADLNADDVSARAHLRARMRKLGTYKFLCAHLP